MTRPCSSNFDLHSVKISYGRADSDFSTAVWNSAKFYGAQWKAVMVLAGIALTLTFTTSQAKPDHRLMAVLDLAPSKQYLRDIWLMSLFQVGSHFSSSHMHLNP